MMRGTGTDAQRRVLVVEDDRDIASLLELHLKDLGCRCDVAIDGERGLQQALTTPYDLIILDLMLPGIDGTEICREIRSARNYTPIMMLTSRAEELDRVLGLELGADDYLTKPFSVREFIARVKAIFRRVEALREEAGRADRSREIIRGPLVIDREDRRVTLQGRKVDLTPKEYELLVLFASHPGRTYTREQLLAAVWGHQFDGYDHTVNSHINRLRSKIEPDATRPAYILTSWGIGYRFAGEDEGPAAP